MNNSKEEETYAQLRRPSEPAKDQLQDDPTVTWILSLPPDVRPHGLARRYPRIANILAHEWRYPARIDSLLKGYLMSDRVKRRGFPREVILELLNLREYLSKTQKRAVKISVWDVTNIE